MICADINAAERRRAEAGSRRQPISRSISSPSISAIPTSIRRSAAAEVLKQYPRIDILVNAAGWGDIQPYIQNPPDFINRVIAINLAGPAASDPGAAAADDRRNGGKIINIASDAGRVGSGGETVYAGAKGGLIAFTKSLAREVARYSINVNCVCPGPTDTPMLATRSEKLREAFLKAIPFRRFAKPEEIADAVLFFASPQVRLRHRPGDERERRADFCRLAHDPKGPIRKVMRQSNGGSMTAARWQRCTGRHRGTLSPRRTRFFQFQAEAFPVEGRRQGRDDHLEPAGTEESADARILCRAARHVPQPAPMPTTSRTS